MNARIDMYSPDEVAKSVGVTGATICNWCRDGLIKCNNVGDGDKPRYEIDENELFYLRSLARKYGPKKVLLYYNQEKIEGAPSIELDKEYSSIEVFKYLGLNHDGVNSNCREGKINCTKKKSNRKGYFEYYIPGWEIAYLKRLYDKYGKKGGRGSALSHYIKDRDKRGVKDMDMPWSLDMDQVENDITEAMIAQHNGEIDIVDAARKVRYTENPDDIVAKKILDNVANPKEEPSDDKLLDNFIKVRELKRDIDNMEAKLNQMKHEYAELKGEIVAWL